MLVFPTNVKATLKLLQSMEAPDFHLDAAVKLAQADPLIAARLVAVANSAAFLHRNGRIENVRTAVNLLGLKTVRALVASIVVRQICSAVADPALRAQADRLWCHCAEVAALANVIARRVAGIDADTAMFAGIVHEIGGFYRIYRADGGAEFTSGAPFATTETTSLDLTRKVLEALLVPESIIAAVEALADEVTAQPPVTLADTLRLANAFAQTPSPMDTEIVADAVAEPAARIDFAVDGQSLQTVLAESATEIGALKDALVI